MPEAEFAFHIPLEKFVVRRNGAWLLDEPLGKEGLKHYLIDRGYQAQEATWVLKSYEYLKVYGADLAPGQPPIFEQSGHTYINTWVPPALVPAPGEFPRVHAVLDFLTQGDAAGKDWLVQWIAAKVQNPAYVPKVAVVLTTEQGAGKGTLAFIIRQMLGESNCATIKRSELENRFNGRWIDKLFVLADEILSNDNVKNISDNLKVYIDGADLELEKKGRDQRVIRNKLAWMFASNDEVSPVSLETSDRRYSVFSNHSPLTSEYDSLLKSCFRTDDRGRPTEEFVQEMAGFYHYLLNLPVDFTVITRPYGNVHRSDLIEASLPSYKHFAQHVLEGGLNELLERVCDHDYALKQSRASWELAPRTYASHVVYQCYVEFCRRVGAKPLKITRFGVAMKKQRPSWEPVRLYAADGQRVRCYVVPEMQ